MKDLTFFKHSIDLELPFDKLKRGDYVYYASIFAQEYELDECYCCQFDHIHSNLIYTSDPVSDGLTYLYVNDVSEPIYIDLTNSKIYILATTKQGFREGLQKFNLDIPADLKTYKLK